MPPKIESNFFQPEKQEDNTAVTNAHDRSLVIKEITERLRREAEEHMKIAIPKIQDMLSQRGLSQVEIDKKIQEFRVAIEINIRKEFNKTLREVAQSKTTYTS